MGPGPFPTASARKLLHKSTNIYPGDRFKGHVVTIFYSIPQKPVDNNRRISSAYALRGCTVDGYRILKFFKDRKSAILGPRRPLQKVGGRSPPTFWKGLRGPRGHPDPRNDRFPTLNKSKIPSRSTAALTISSYSAGSISGAALHRTSTERTD